jgi:Zn-dependent protease
MQDPFAWSFPLGRIFGITIRVHILFPFVVLAVILRAAFQKEPPTSPNGWIDVSIICVFFFVSVLLHEFGHCFGARAVGGDASEILMWPLGGLASLEVPHTPRANFITTLAGPGVNFVLCLLALLGLYFAGSYQPNWDPFYYLGRYIDADQVPMRTWAGETIRLSPYDLAVLLCHLFWVNYVLFLLNMLLIGFPLDGGRLFQSVVWKYTNYRRGTLAAVYAGFVTMFIVGLFAIISGSILSLCLALFIYQSCKQQWILLETGGEESLFGYDFSQGYTSLERDEPPPPQPAKPKQSWWQRWKQRRAERKAREEAERREADERRLDELLDKVARQGINSLTDEERRFMQRVSDRYRNRNSG